MAKCLECQLVYVEHHPPIGILYSHDIPYSEWEARSMDFIIVLPVTAIRNNSLLVVVDKHIKSDRLILVKDTYKAHEIRNCLLMELWDSMVFQRK